MPRSKPHPSLSSPDVPREPSPDDPAMGQVEQALIDKLEEEHEFQKYLKALHEITIELTLIDQLEMFYQRVVELARELLDFERIALFLLEPDEWLARGTYGTNIYGETTDEHHLTFVPSPNGAMRRAFDHAERFTFDEDVPLLDNNLPAGVRGWNATTILWDGTQALGWLVTDNAIRRKPASKPQLDALGLLGLGVGALLARKRTEAALRQSETDYRLLAEHISDVVLRMTATLAFLYISPSSLTVVGYTPEELIQIPILDLIHADDRDLLQSLFATAMSQPSPHLRASFRFQHRKGYYLWVEINAQIIRSQETGQIREFIATARDITDRKRTEDALRHSLEHEKELGELKSRFVMMASHEFRTPLTNILTASQLLAAYRQRMNEAQITEKLDRIGGQVAHLNGIIDDVLHLTRVQSGKVDFAPVEMDFDALCRKIIPGFLEQERIDRSIDYHCDFAPLMIYADRRLIQRIVDNLVSNAVKFSPEESTVEVRLWVEDNTAVLTVQDSGIGIPENDLKYLFNPFHRAANAGMISGRGLGLAITKEAVDVHHGRIAVTTAEGIGTTFRVEIPIVRAER